jgi:predicted GNAT family acetyltransferase
MTTTVTEQPARHRYEIAVDDALAGFTMFTIDGDVAIMSHTMIDREYEGRGLGSTLIGSALDDLRQRGVTVVPRCPFVRAFIDEHPEYQDLLSDR